MSYQTLESKMEKYRYRKFDLISYGNSSHISRRFDKKKNSEREKRKKRNPYKKGGAP